MWPGDFSRFDIEAHRCPSGGRRAMALETSQVIRFLSIASAGVHPHRLNGIPSACRVVLVARTTRSISLADAGRRPVESVSPPDESEPK